MGALQRRKNGLPSVGEHDDRLDALGDHALDVGDGLLRVALTVRVLEVRDVRALRDLVLGRCSGDETPAVSTKAVGEPEGRLLGTAPGRNATRGRARRREGGGRR